MKSVFSFTHVLGSFCLFSMNSPVYAVDAQNAPIRVAVRSDRGRDVLHSSAPNSTPYVVGAVCNSDDASTRVVSAHGQHMLTIQATNEVIKRSSLGGFEVFNSNAGVHPGNSYPVSSNTAPTGTYTFTISGLNGQSTLLIISKDSLGGTTNSTASVNNGVVSVTAPPILFPTAHLTTVYFFIYRVVNPLNSYSVSNFSVNKTHIAIDPTHTDVGTKATGTNADFSWCNTVGIP